MFNDWRNSMPRKSDFADCPLTIIISLLILILILI
jgi:hypothetical protein